MKQAVISILLISCTAVLLSCSASKTLSSKSADVEPQSFVLNSELGTYNLLVNIPKGWESVFHNQLPGGFVAEFLPKEQNLASWEDMISLMVKGVAFPPNYSEAHTIIIKSSTLNETTCKNFKRSELIDYEQYGLKTVEFYIECPSTALRPGAGEAIVYKYVLAGDKVGLITAWKSWKIKNESDLQKARQEYSDYISLFRQINLLKVTN